MLASGQKTSRPGTLVTVAGTGEPGYSGDGGQALSARLNEPKQVALDGMGGLYIADSENHLIRRLDLSTGTIETVAGRCDNPGSVAGDHPWQPHGAVEPEEEDPLGDSTQVLQEKFVQITDLSGTVRFVVGTAAGAAQFKGDGGQATDATLNFPSGLAVRDGALFIADTMNHRVRKVDLATGVITTVAGTGQRRHSGDGGSSVSAALNEPCALVLDDKGNLYIADQSNNRIRLIDARTGIITTVAGTGEAAYSGDGIQARESALAGPSGLALGPDGGLYIADTFNGRIRRVDLESGIVATVAGDGQEYRYGGLPNEFSTSLSRPYGIAVDGQGNVLITDSDSHLIRCWDRKRKIITRLAGNGIARYCGEGLAATESSLNYPFGVAVDDAGTIYIADTFNHRIRMIAA